MYFSELINSVDKEKTVQVFLERCDESPDINKTKDAISETIDIIKTMTPNYSDEYTIHVGLDEKDTSDFTYILGQDEKEPLGIEIDDWSNILGYKIGEDELKKYDREYVVASVLWEMTWFGYDEETIKKHIESWDE